MMDFLMVCFIVTAGVAFIICILAIADWEMDVAITSVGICGIFTIASLVLSHNTNPETITSKYINKECSTSFTSQEVSKFPEAILISLEQNPCKDIVERILKPSKENF